ncbi:MAG: hypothetical protein C3F18_09300, partial [Nitrosomonadales bacterium]
LEFHAVFISGLEEGLFPHENVAKRSFGGDFSAQQVSRNQNAAQERDGLEEERRLMYVAITRARRRLYLSFADSRMLHGQLRYGIASRFLDELPPALLKRLNRAAARTAEPLMQATPARSGSPEAGSPWHVGQAVRHAKFGPGIIINSEGRGADARVQVSFSHSGVKWLALEYAKLEAV